MVRAVALGVGIVLACLGASATQAAELMVGNKSADTVWRLSLRDGRKTGEYRTGEAPHEIAVAPDGRTAVTVDIELPGLGLVISYAGSHGPEDSP